MAGQGVTKPSFFDRYKSGYDWGTAGGFVGGAGKGYQDVMSLYNLSKLGDVNFAGKAGTVLSTLALATTGTPAQPFLAAASLIANIFSRQARHGLRG